MSHAIRLHDGKGEISVDPGLGILEAYGNTVPADASLGYAPGCHFIHTDGSGEADLLYVNMGTKASSNFDAVDFNIAESAFLSGVVAGTVSASKAVVVDASNDITGFRHVTTTGTFTSGSDATDKVAIKGFYMSPANVSVTVPAITDPDIAKVDVNVASAFSMAPAVGDAVIAIPQEAMEANARILGCYVTATDQITVVFGSEGGNVTGGAKNFKFIVIDVT